MCRPPSCLGPVDMSSSLLPGPRWRVVLHLVRVPLLCNPPPCLGPVAVSSSLLPGTRLLCHAPPSLLHVSYCCIIYHPGAGCRVILHTVTGCVPFIFPLADRGCFRTLPSAHPHDCFIPPVFHPPYRLTHRTSPTPLSSTLDFSISVPEHPPRSSYSA